MRLVDIVSRETGAEFSQIMLLRHSNQSISRLIACGGSVEEYTAIQPTDTPYDYWVDDRERIAIVVAIANDRVSGVYRVAGFTAEGTRREVESEAHRRFDVERGKSLEEIVRVFDLERIRSSADDLPITGWTQPRSPIARSDGKQFWKIEVIPSRPNPIDVDDRDLSESEIEDAIREGRLRFGMVATSSAVALSRRRIGHDVLRKLTLENYDECCAICDIQDQRLLRVSHIVGWAEREDTRGNLNNVICLCSFHDVLFEYGYWSLDDRFRVILRSDIESEAICRLLTAACAFREPFDHSPAIEFIRHHRQKHGLPSKRRGSR
jgi:hypothetical protein